MFARFQTHSSPLVLAFARASLQFYDEYMTDRRKTFDFNAFAINSDENVL